jgi:hypothetical protein
MDLEGGLQRGFGRVHLLRCDLALQAVEVGDQGRLLALGGRRLLGAGFGECVVQLALFGRRFTLLRLMNGGTHDKPPIFPVSRFGCG